VHPRVLGSHPPTETLGTQGAEVASSGTSLTSITSSVLRGKVEDGRVYAVYGKEGMWRLRSRLVDEVVDMNQSTACRWMIRNWTESVSTRGWLFLLIDSRDGGERLWLGARPCPYIAS
jgi:hypothetical protein